MFIFSLIQLNSLKPSCEALLCLEMFWRNDRWHLLFPHAILTNLANN